MEIALITNTSLKIKGKLATFIVDPTETKAKIIGDAVLLLQENPTEIPEIEGCRLVMSGPGEYEIGGVKITGVKGVHGMLYYLTIEGISTLVTSVSNLKGKESLRDVDMAVLLAESLVDQSALASATNSIAVFYGPQAQENAKALGKTPESVSKYVVTKDKLPSEMEIVLLSS